ncbi:YihY/virulence factor BrkB family protein, partial [Burkholderia cenocepacia]|uniref:YihY/virulence factor BrkB family protein n=1 Tax=Burkholderia cenocepacia TaxID=95486 RepID=UPI0038CC153D
LYHATPNVQQPKMRWISPGGIVGLVVLAIASLGFFFYVANFSSYDRTYGSIGGVIVLLLWLWIVNLALLIGAEFDAELERGRQLQGGIDAEEDIQLPPRDTRQIERQEQKEQRLVEQARRLRRTKGGSGRR